MAAGLAAGDRAGAFAAELLAALAFAGGVDTLSFFAGFFVPCTAASLFEDAFSHDALVEPLEGIFEGFVLAYDYFNQWAAGCSLHALAGPNGESRRRATVP